MLHQLLYGLLYRRSLFRLVFLLFLADQTPSLAAERKLHYLIYGSAAEPFQFIPSQGLGAGLITDVVKAVFEGSDYNLTAVVRPVKRIKRDMYADRIPNWITYGFRTWQEDPSWKHQYLAEVDLFSYEFYFVSLRERELALRDWNGLQGRTVLLIRGFEYGGLKILLEAHRAILFDAVDQRQALKLLRHERADFYYGNPLRVEYFIRQIGWPVEDFSLVPSGKATPVTLMMDHRLSEETKMFVNARLGVLRDNGTIERILARYRR